MPFNVLINISWNSDLDLSADKIEVFKLILLLSFISSKSENESMLLTLLFLMLQLRSIEVGSLSSLNSFILSLVSLRSFGVIEGLLSVLTN